MNKYKEYLKKCFNLDLVSCQYCKEFNYKNIYNNFLKKMKILKMIG